MAENGKNIDGDVLVDLNYPDPKFTDNAKEGVEQQGQSESEVNSLRSDEIRALVEAAEKIWGGESDYILNEFNNSSKTPLEGLGGIANVPNMEFSHGTVGKAAYLKLEKNDNLYGKWTVYPARGRYGTAERLLSVSEASLNLKYYQERYRELDDSLREGRSNENDPVRKELGRILRYLRWRVFDSKKDLYNAAMATAMEFQKKKEGASLAWMRPSHNDGKTQWKEMGDYLIKGSFDWMDGKLSTFPCDYFENRDEGVEYASGDELWLRVGGKVVPIEIKDSLSLNPHVPKTESGVGQLSREEVNDAVVTKVRDICGDGKKAYLILRDYNGSLGARTPRFELESFYDVGIAQEGGESRVSKYVGFVKAVADFVVGRFVEEFPEKLLSQVVDYKSDLVDAMTYCHRLNEYLDKGELDDNSPVRKELDQMVRFLRSRVLDSKKGLYNAVMALAKKKAQKGKPLEMIWVRPEGNNEVPGKNEFLGKKELDLEGSLENLEDAVRKLRSNFFEENGSGKVFAPKDQLCLRLNGRDFPFEIKEFPSLYPHVPKTENGVEQLSREEVNYSVITKVKDIYKNDKKAFLILRDYNDALETPRIGLKSFWDVGANIHAKPKRKPIKKASKGNLRKQLSDIRLDLKEARSQYRQLNDSLRNGEWDDDSPVRKELNLILRFLGKRVEGFQKEFYNAGIALAGKYQKKGGGASLVWFRPSQNENEYEVLKRQILDLEGSLGYLEDAVRKSRRKMFNGGDEFAAHDELRLEVGGTDVPIEIGGIPIKPLPPKSKPMGIEERIKKYKKRLKKIRKSKTPSDAENREKELLESALVDLKRLKKSENEGPEEDLSGKNRNVDLVEDMFEDVDLGVNRPEESSPMLKRPYRKPSKQDEHGQPLVRAFVPDTVPKEIGKIDALPGLIENIYYYKGYDEKLGRPQLQVKLSEDALIKGSQMADCIEIFFGTIKEKGDGIEGEDAIVDLLCAKFEKSKLLYIQDVPDLMRDIMDDSRFEKKHEPFITNIQGRLLKAVGAINGVSSPEKKNGWMSFQKFGRKIRGLFSSSDSVGNMEIVTVNHRLPSGTNGQTANKVAPPLPPRPVRDQRNEEGQVLAKNVDEGVSGSEEGNVRPVAGGIKPSFNWIFKRSTAPEGVARTPHNFPSSPNGKSKNVDDGNVTNSNGNKPNINRNDVISFRGVAPESEVNLNAEGPSLRSAGKNIKMDNSSFVKVSGVDKLLSPSEPPAQVLESSNADNPSPSGTKETVLNMSRPIPPVPQGTFVNQGNEESSLEGAIEANSINGHNVDGSSNVLEERRRIVVVDGAIVEKGLTPNVYNGIVPEGISKKVYDGTKKLQELVRERNNYGQKIKDIIDNCLTVVPNKKELKKIDRAVKGLQRHGGIPSMEDAIGWVDSQDYLKERKEYEVFCLYLKNSFLNCYKEKSLNSSRFPPLYMVDSISYQTELCRLLAKREEVISPDSDEYRRKYQDIDPRDKEGSRKGRVFYHIRPTMSSSPFLNRIYVGIINRFYRIFGMPPITDLIDFWHARDQLWTFHTNSDAERTTSLPPQPRIVHGIGEVPEMSNSIQSSEGVSTINRSDVISFQGEKSEANLDARDSSLKAFGKNTTIDLDSSNAQNRLPSGTTEAAGSNVPQPNPPLTTESLGSAHSSRHGTNTDKRGASKTQIARAPRR